MLRQPRLLKPDARWHCNILPIRLKCILCTSEVKNPKSIPVSKSVRSLIFHLAIEHKNEYGSDECKELLKAISTALNLGLICHD